MSEEAIYELILVSGMIVVSGSSTGTAVDALITVGVTVIVFFAAHVFAGTLGRLAATDGKAGLRASLRASAHQSGGMLLAAVPPLLILLLGATRLIDGSLRALGGTHRQHRAPRRAGVDRGGALELHWLRAFSAPWSPPRSAGCSSC